ncbi:hypothetical protein E143388_06476 [Rhodococcus opacus]|nr:hypothetical protein E143388_06476 [Rhodococcus opacus]
MFAFRGVSADDPPIATSAATNPALLADRNGNGYLLPVDCRRPVPPSRTPRGREPRACVRRRHRGVHPGQPPPPTRRVHLRARGRGRRRVGLPGTPRATRPERVQLLAGLERCVPVCLSMFVRNFSSGPPPELTARRRTARCRCRCRSCRPRPVGDRVEGHFRGQHERKRPAHGSHLLLWVRTRPGSPRRGRRVTGLAPSIGNGAWG